MTRKVFKLNSSLLPSWTSEWWHLDAGEFMKCSVSVLWVYLVQCVPVCLVDLWEYSWAKTAAFFLLNSCCLPTFTAKAFLGDKIWALAIINVPDYVILRFYCELPRGGVYNSHPLEHDIWTFCTEGSSMSPWVCTWQFLLVKGKLGRGLCSPTSFL